MRLIGRGSWGAISGRERLGLRLLLLFRLILLLSPAADDVKREVHLLRVQRLRLAEPEGLDGAVGVEVVPLVVLLTDCVATRGARLR